MMIRYALNWTVLTFDHLMERFKICCPKLCPSSLFFVDVTFDASKAKQNAISETTAHLHLTLARRECSSWVRETEHERRAIEGNCVKVLFLSFCTSADNFAKVCPSFSFLASARVSSGLMSAHSPLQKILVLRPSPPPTSPTPTSYALLCPPSFARSN